MFHLVSFDLTKMCRRTTRLRRACPDILETHCGKRQRFSFFGKNYTCLEKTYWKHTAEKDKDFLFRKSMYLVAYVHNSFAHRKI